MIKFFNRWNMKLALSWLRYVTFCEGVGLMYASSRRLFMLKERWRKLVGICGRVLSQLLKVWREKQIGRKRKTCQYPVRLPLNRLMVWDIRSSVRNVNTTNTSDVESNESILKDDIQLYQPINF